MPLDTFEGMGHTVGLAITDSDGAAVDPTDSSIRNILMYIISKNTGEVIGKFSRDVLVGYDTADLTTEPGKMVMYLNDANTIDQITGYYEGEVHLQIYDPNFQNGYRTYINKCMFLNLNPAHHG